MIPLSLDGHITAAIHLKIHHVKTEFDATNPSHTEVKKGLLKSNNFNYKPGNRERKMLNRQKKAKEQQSSLLTCIKFVCGSTFRKLLASLISVVLKKQMQ